MKREKTYTEMIEHSEFDIGDKVYVFKRGCYDWFLDSLRKGNFTNGTIISVDHVDYGYHGSGDWVWVYEIECDDGKIHVGDYNSGYNECSIYTKDDIINELNSYISGGLYQLEKLRHEVTNNNLEYQLLIEKYNDLEETKGRQKSKGKR